MSLSASSVSVRRGTATLLEQVSVSLDPQEIVALIGPNGAGKSTLLHTLSGIVTADDGTAGLDGRPLAEWPRRALARRRAVLPQTPTLAFPFSVLDVVLLGRSPHATRDGTDDALTVAESALAEVDALHLADRSYPTLSGGERQRVHIARALAQIWPGTKATPAAYLLLDEPTNNLDIAHQHALMATARRFAERGCGILAVLHDPNLASAYADRVVVLAGGRIIAEGTPEDVITERRLFESFGLRATVIPHPRTGRPIMLPVPHGQAGGDGPGSFFSASNDRRTPCSLP